MAVARSCSEETEMACTSGFVDDVMFVHNRRSKLAKATPIRRILEVTHKSPGTTPGRSLISTIALFLWTTTMMVYLLRCLLILKCYRLNMLVHSLVYFRYLLVIMVAL